MTGPGASELRDLPLAAIEAAAGRIRGMVRRTPMLASRTAARMIADRYGIELGSGPAPDVGPRVFVKAEHLQVTGSFKPRGAVNKVAALTPDERARGLIALSAGNHAQAVAYAATAQGIPVAVVMPAGASLAKAAAAAGYGAEVILHGEDVRAALAHLEELRDQRGLVYVPPFDDPAIIAGQGTVGLEIVADLPEVNVVVVGIGGGGLISGIAAAIRQARPQARVYGVEPEGSIAMAAALSAGHVVDVVPESIADGLGAPFAGAWTLDLVRRYVERVVLVRDAEIAAAMRFALERMKQLLEPAGAAALAAVLSGRIPLRPGDTVCVVASGGNVDLARLPDLLVLADDVEWW